MMNLNDLLGAIEDMLKCHGSKLDDIVYIQQSNGNIRAIDGFHYKDGKVFIK